MKMPKKINGPLALVLSALAVLVVLGVGWFMLVSPQRSKADALDTQIGSTEAQLTDAQHLLAAPNKRQTAAALATATRALPDTPQMSNVLRQLYAASAKSKTELDSITPTAQIPASGASPLPMTIAVKGRYFAIQRFVRLLRQSVDVKNGKLAGKGRLYTIDNITFVGQAAPEPGQATANGVISATLALNAFVASSAAAPTSATTTDTTTSGTDATAAGVTP